MRLSRWRKWRRLICRGPTSSVVAIFEAFRQRVDFRPISLEAAVGVVVGGRRATQKRWDLDLRLAPTSPKSIQGEECDDRRRAGQCQVNPGDQGRSSLASPVAQASRSGSGGSPVFRSHATSSVGHLNRLDGCGSRRKAGTSKISGLLSLELVIAAPEMCIGHPRTKYRLTGRVLGCFDVKPITPRQLSMLHWFRRRCHGSGLAAR